MICNQNMVFDNVKFVKSSKLFLTCAIPKVPLYCTNPSFSKFTISLYLTLLYHTCRHDGLSTNLALPLTPTITKVHVRILLQLMSTNIILLQQEQSSYVKLLVIENLISLGILNKQMVYKIKHLNFCNSIPLHFKFICILCCLIQNILMV